jgi:hypothetical protein
VSDTGATKEMPLHIASSSDGELTSEDSHSDPIEIGVENGVGRSMAEADTIIIIIYSYASQKIWP